VAPTPSWNLKAGVVLDTVLFDFQLSEPLRRQQLYSGRVFVFSPRASTIALCEFARSMIEEAFWDIYYEHCSYFSIGSLARLFRRAGFDVLDLGREYGDQYLTIEARPGDGAASPGPAEDDLGNLRTMVRSFAARVPRRIAVWRERLGYYREKGLKTVVWGAGSKGVTFLSTLNVPGAVKYVVDINPNMSSHYTAKTGLEIVTPSVLCDYRPDVVIVMNPVYRQEIIAQLSTLRLTPEVIST
jgi:hypothetical protein